MARTTYTREFKLQAPKLLTEQGLSVVEVARRLGVTEGVRPGLAGGRRGARRVRLAEEPQPEPGR
ncbi:MAG: transposase [Gemmataceae bacterium]